MKSVPAAQPADGVLLSVGRIEPNAVITVLAMNSDGSTTNTRMNAEFDWPHVAAGSN